MPYNFVAESFHKELCGRFSSREVNFYAENRHIAFFEPPPPLFGGCEATYAVHLRFTGKLLVNFLNFLSLGATDKALRANID